MWSYEKEKESALAQDAMTQGQWMTAAVRQYADVEGAERPEAAYILSPYDTWERNPHYRGPKGRHPEDYADDYDDEDSPLACEAAPAGESLDFDDIPF